MTRAFGALLVEHGHSLVYGGGHVGLMGEIADSVLAAGGHVTGVMPKHLVDRELAHPGVQVMHVVDDMHQRKAKMAELADAFIALPGGAGTMEELFEAWTWGQLGLHAKPCGVLNMHDYFGPLLAFAARMVDCGFMKQPYLDMLQVGETPENLLAKIERYTPPPMKWSSAADRRS
ncbi:TIGR00730 family Rossman fold protein [Paludibacterium paludis]|uniref:LOG family protein n=1 Tax=Paludibacterium paludis TaxID=1225769 RepID=UPI001E2AD156